MGLDSVALRPQIIKFSLGDVTDSTKMKMGCVVGANEDLLLSCVSGSDLNFLPANPHFLLHFTPFQLLPLSLLLCGVYYFLTASASFLCSAPCFLRAVILSTPPLTLVSMPP